MMIKKIQLYNAFWFVLISCFFIPFTNGQELTSLTELDPSVKETSGLIYVDGRLITHNDSGGEAALFELDQETGEVTRKVKVKNAKNIDWESITQDGENIYIGDIGNNVGNRKDLCIYIISIEEYLNTNNTEVNSEKITFSYADQTDFASKPYQNDFDAEALLAFRDSLYIFSKNWKSFTTKVYALPKIAGNYKIQTKKTFESQFLVTDATYNPYTNTILLVGYGTLNGFVLSINDLSMNSFYNAKIKKTLIPFEIFHQLEGITTLSKDEYYVTCEGTSKIAPQLYKLKYDNQKLDTKKEEELVIYYQPGSKSLYVNIDLFEQGEIYNSRGQKVMNFTLQNVNLDRLAPGLYFTYLTTKDGKQKKPFKFIIM